MIKDYKVIRDKRKKRNISISVENDGTVLVKAPIYVPDREIESVLEKREQWILKVQKKLEEKRKTLESLPKYSDIDITLMRLKAKWEIPELVKKYAKIMGLQYNNITFKTQKTRWGSCSSKKNLNFNIAIMEAPERVREYLVVHELAHLKHMNHSKKYWKYVETIISDYKECEKWLKTDGKIVIARLNVWREGREK